LHERPEAQCAEAWEQRISVTQEKTKEYKKRIRKQTKPRTLRKFNEQLSAAAREREEEEKGPSRSAAPYAFEER